MFDDISLESVDDKWKWGSILGGIGLSVLSTGILIGCVCRCCLDKRKRKMKEKIEKEIKEKEKQKERIIYSTSNVAPVLNKVTNNANAPPIYLEDSL